MHKTPHSRLRRAAFQACLLLLLGGGRAAAATTQVKILLDLDNNPSTGCTIATPAGPFQGAEEVIVATFDTATNMVTAEQLQLCTGTGGSLGAPTPINAPFPPPWPMGPGQGSGGSTLIEGYLPLSDAPGAGVVRVGFVVGSAGADEDALLPAQSFFAAGPAIPTLSEMGLVVFSLGLLIAGFFLLRRHTGVLAVLGALALLAGTTGVAWAAIGLHGQASDWAGISPLGTKPASPNPTHSEILAVYGVTQGSNLFFRVDANLGGPAGPAITSPNQATFTAGVTALFTVTTSGLPAPSLAEAGTLPAGVAFIDNGDGTGMVLGTAAAGTGGAHGLTLTAHNGAGPDGVQAFTLTVLEGAPSLAAIVDQTIPLGSAYSVRLAANDPNPTAVLTYFLDAKPAGAGFNPNPIVQWIPTAAQVGVNTFTARVVDGAGRSDVKSFHVTVTPADRPPKLGTQPDAVLEAGGVFNRVLTATDPDAGDVLTFSLVSGPPGLTLVGAQLTWLPVTSTTGDYFVTVRVTDSAGARNDARFRLTVIPAVPPVAQNDSYQVVLGATLTVPSPGVLSNDSDPNSFPLAAARLTDPDKGTVSAFNADGSFTYQAPPTLPGPVFAPTVKYHIDGATVGGSFAEAPLVIDVDGDGRPEIVALSGGPGFGIGAFRGTDGSALWRTQTLPPPYDDCTVGLFTGGNLRHLAAGDIDDTGQVSIVFPTSCGRDNLPTRIVGTSTARYAAINGKDGTFKWLSPPLGGVLDSNGNPDPLAAGTVPTIARLRSGETPSVLVGRDLGYGDFAGQPECAQLVPGWQLLQPPNTGCRGVFAIDGKDGTVRQRMAAPYPGAYPPDAPLYGNGTSAAVAADLDGDGSVEILFGNAVFNNNGSVRSNNADNPGADCCAVSFWNGLGNFDDTPDIEVVRLEGGGFTGLTRLGVYKSDSSLLWAVPLTRRALIGIPAVADVDGTGRPSVVLSINSNVCAIDYKGNYKWCHDVGSGLVGTEPNVGYGVGLQVFDLDGDGVPEVIVPIEGEQLLFLDGATGNVKASLDMAAAHGPPFYPPYLDSTDYSGGPIVADVDGSGHAAIISIWGGANRLNVVASATNNWRPARKVFNQESYQFGNINENGSIPNIFVNNFATPATNVFRNPGQVLAPVDPRLKSQTSFNYAATNGMLTSAPAKVAIDILPVNRPPVFVTTPPTHYLPITTTFSYAAHAVDPDPGDTVTYSILLQVVNGACAIDASSGVLSCSILFNGDQTFVIAATDSFGAAAYQNIVLHESPGSAIVPNVIGQTQAAAASALTAALLSVGKVTQFYDPSPAGTVLSQAPSTGASLPQGESVDISVSLGPTPRAVPNVIGKSLSSAGAALGASGFTTGATTYQYDTTVPRGTVLGQNPAGGTIIQPAPVALTISAGTGLELRLSRSFTTADVPITITPVAFDLSGNEFPAPPLNYDPIAAPGPFQGPLPTRTGTTLTFDTLTRGAFQVSATDPVSGHRASSGFAVAQPQVAGVDGDVDEFARLSEVFEGLDALSRQAAAALAANDDAAMRARLTDMVNLWRTIDVDALKLSTPFSPEGGFPPTVRDLGPLGITPGPDDAVNKQLLIKTAADLQAWIDGLNNSGQTLQGLNTLAAAFADDASRLPSLSPGVYGVVDAMPTYATALSRRIPGLMEAVMNQIGQIVGLPPRASDFPGLLRVRVRDTESARVKGPSPNFSLAELLVTQAVQYIVDTISDAKKYTKDVLVQAGEGAAIVAAANILKSSLGAQPIIGVVAGASLSFHEFNAPNSMIEGIGLEEEDPDLNTVILIGPDLINSVVDIVGQIKGVFKNKGEVKSNFKKFKERLKSLKNGAQSLVDQATKAFQITDTFDGPCLFSSDPECVELLYPDGFHSVYTYTAPSGLGGFTGLPLPILFIVYDNVHGQVLIDTPEFLPCSNKLDPHACD